MKIPRLLQISALCLLSLTACEKKEGKKNDETLSPKRQSRDTVSQERAAATPEEDHGLADDIRAVQKRLGKETVHTASDWAKLRASYWPSSWQATFPTDPSKSVRELVKEHNYEPLLGKAGTGDLADLAGDEAECLSIWFAASLLSSYSPADSLPNAFAVLGETPDSTKGDLILYVFFRDAYVNSHARSPLDPTQKEQWRKMSESPNPVVRLLAAETYLHVEENVSDCIGFYSAFKGDSDPYIVEKALSAIYTSGKSEAIGILKEFDKSEVVGKNPQLRQKIASMIHSRQKNAVQEK